MGHGTYTERRHLSLAFKREPVAPLGFRAVQKDRNYPRIGLGEALLQQESDRILDAIVAVTISFAQVG